jgi:hypothetical protein
VDGRKDIKEGRKDITDGRKEGYQQEMGEGFKKTVKFYGGCY